MSLFVYFGLLYLLQSLYCFVTFATTELMSVRVRRLEVGFGPTISDFTLGHTRFLLKLVPLTATVNTEGSAWDAQPPWRQLMVVVAGPFSLVLFGCLILALATRLYGTPVALNATSVAGVSAGSPAATAGVAAGDVILSLAGTEVSTWTELRRLVRQAGSNPFDGSLLRQGALLTVTIAPSFDRRSGGFLTLFAGRTVAGMQEQIERHHHDLLGSLVAGVRAGARLSSLCASAFWQMSTGPIDGDAFDALRLPSGDSGQWTTRRGALEWDSAQRTRGEASLWLYASVTILFGIFNLLPVPWLNGGRAVVIVVEALRGQPLNERAQARLRMAGFLVLGVLMARFIYFDMVGR